MPSIKVTFQGMEPSPALQADIEEHAGKLVRFAPRLSACQATVQQSERRHQKGNRYEVHARVTLPGGEFEAGRNTEHEDPYVAVRDTFDALRRQLEDFMRVRRGEVKSRSGERPSS